MKPQKAVNLWLGTVSMGHRKSCPQCSRKLTEGNTIVQVGVYERGSFSLLFHACALCLMDTVDYRLNQRIPKRFCVRSGHSIPWLRDVVGKDHFKGDTNALVHSFYHGIRL
jgi:hypothetical protein